MQPVAYAKNVSRVGSGSRRASQVMAGQQSRLENGGLVGGVQMYTGISNACKCILLGVQHNRYVDIAEEAVLVGMKVGEAMIRFAAFLQVCIGMCLRFLMHERVMHYFLAAEYGSKGNKCQHGQHG